jgi:dTMP kinase
MLIANNNPALTVPLGRRGAFIVLEGVDRCGKTTQSALLLKKLVSLGIAAVAMRFPDRTTPVGQLINSYLTSGSELDDHAIHLLFSANRWEAAPKLTEVLSQGTTIVCDRYAHSGVAFSSAKVNDQNEAIMSMDWCKSSDVGLPAPDAVIFLDLAQEEAERRGG